MCVAVELPDIIDVIKINIFVIKYIFNDPYAQEVHSGERYSGYKSNSRRNQKRTEFTSHYCELYRCNDHHSVIILFYISDSFNFEIIIDHLTLNK